MHTPILETERLVLRPFEKEDAKDVLRCIIDFATEQLKIFQIVGRYAKENPASGNVMKKIGFQYEKDIPYECNDGTVMRDGIQCRWVLAK